MGANLKMHSLSTKRKILKEPTLNESETENAFPFNILFFIFCFSDDNIFMVLDLDFVSTIFIISGSFLRRNCIAHIFGFYFCKYLGLSRQERNLLWNSEKTCFQEMSLKLNQLMVACLWLFSKTNHFLMRCHHTILKSSRKTMIFVEYRK